jgi:beta-xylosidase
MIEAIQFWSEPNSPAHWDQGQDPDGRRFAAMVRPAVAAVRDVAPGVTRVMGGLSPAEPEYLARLRDLGGLEGVDAVAVHGYPFDWHLWKLNEWPAQIEAIRSVTGGLPVWVTEAGASTFGAEEMQPFALKRTAEMLLPRAERVYWNSLLDLPPTWDPNGRHRESEGSSYYRYFYLGLIRADGTTKPAAETYGEYAPDLGISQRFFFWDSRLEDGAAWLRRLGVRRLRITVAWADWLNENAAAWFDRQMDALHEFDTTVTLCFTPPSRGLTEHYTAPPRHPEEFAEFAAMFARRYVLHEGWRPSSAAERSLALAAEEDEELAAAVLGKR